MDFSLVSALKISLRSSAHMCQFDNKCQCQSSTLTDTKNVKSGSVWHNSSVINTYSVVLVDTIECCSTLWYSNWNFTQYLNIFHWSSLSPNTTCWIYCHTFYPQSSDHTWWCSGFVWLGLRLNQTKSKFHDGTPREHLMYGDLHPNKTVT